MKATLMRSILLAAGVALAMPIFANDDPNPVPNCDETKLQKDDVNQNWKRDPRCAEPTRSLVEEGSLPVSSDMSRHRERINNPDSAPNVTPESEGKGRK